MSEEKFKTPSSDFGMFFDKVSWFALTAVAIYVATQLNKMSESVTKLNENVAVMVSKVQYTEKMLDNHNRDILDLKEKVGRIGEKYGRR